MNDKVKELEAELKQLKDKREQESRIKALKKQIKAEKFSQTKGGKVLNAIGGFGKKLLTPAPQTLGKKKKVKKSNVENIENILRRLPQ